MDDFRQEVILYVNRVILERLANDPDRRTALRDLARYFDNNRDCTPIQRNQMVREMFGDQNHDLAHVYIGTVQELYEPALRFTPAAERTKKLIKLAKICYCIQFLDLYRERFPVPSPAHSNLSDAMIMFIADRMPDSELCGHLCQVLLQFPDFRNELETRVNRHTSLFRDDGGGDGNNPGAGNPPPQF